MPLELDFQSHAQIESILLSNACLNIMQMTYLVAQKGLFELGSL